VALLVDSPGAKRRSTWTSGVDEVDGTGTTVVWSMSCVCCGGVAARAGVGATMNNVETTAAHAANFFPWRVRVGHDNSTFQR
jgi:hypothetical protein